MVFSSLSCAVLAVVVRQRRRTVLPSSSFCFIFIEKKSAKALFFSMEATPRFELGNKGFADLCLTTWLCRHMYRTLTASYF